MDIDKATDKEICDWIAFQFDRWKRIPRKRKKLYKDFILSYVLLQEQNKMHPQLNWNQSIPLRREGLGVRVLPGVPFYEGSFLFDNDEFINFEIVSFFHQRMIDRLYDSFERDDLTGKRRIGSWHLSKENAKDAAWILSMSGLKAYYEEYFHKGDVFFRGEGRHSCFVDLKDLARTPRPNVLKYARENFQ